MRPAGAGAEIGAGLTGDGIDGKARKISVDEFAAATDDEEHGRMRDDVSQDLHQDAIEEARLYNIALRLARAGMLDELSRPRKSRRPPPAPWRPATCQWIAGAPTDDDNCKCGRPVAPGRSYCPAHLSRVHLRRRRVDVGSEM